MFDRGWLHLTGKDVSVGQRMVTVNKNIECSFVMFQPYIMIFMLH